MGHKKDCVCYYRTSTVTNRNGDSLKRQKSNVHRWCRNNGYRVRGEWWDIESGTVDVLERHEFGELLSFCEKEGIDTVVFENSSRFSRDLIVGEIGRRFLVDMGIKLISSESPESWTSDEPTTKLIRHVLSSVSEFEKCSLVKKLKVSRRRKRKSNEKKGVVTMERTGKCEGRKRILELHPELESLVIKLRRKGFSYRKISDLLRVEYGLSVSFMSVREIMKDIEWMRREKRNRKRRRRTETV